MCPHHELHEQVCQWLKSTSILDGGRANVRIASGDRRWVPRRVRHRTFLPSFIANDRACFESGTLFPDFGVGMTFAELCTDFTSAGISRISPDSSNKIWGDTMLELKVENIAISDIVLDVRNPRIAPWIETVTGTPSEDWILLALGKHSGDDEEHSNATSYSSLKESIRAGGGIMQPITVSQRDDGKYVVIEGNTRVAIYLELASDGVPGHWGAIPAIVRSGSDEKTEHAIRLQAHLVGPRPWRPYAKAKYLHDLQQHQKLSTDEIQAICGGGGRRREIEEYIQAYKDIVEFYIPALDGEPVDASRFSAFVELQKPPVVQALLKHGYSKTDFAKWLNTDKFKPLNTVRALPRILANPKAKQMFLSRGASEAMRLIEQPASSEVIKDASIDQLASALAIKMRNLSWPEAKTMIEDPDGRTSLAIADCFAELSTIYKQIFPDADE